MKRKNEENIGDTQARIEKFMKWKIEFYLIVKCIKSSLKIF